MPVIPFDPLAPVPGPRYPGSAQFQLLGKGRVRVCTGARIHFGFLSLPGATDPYWLDVSSQPTLPARRYGGAGLMIPKPGFSLLAEPSSHWEFQGQPNNRLIDYAQRLCQFLEGKGCHLPARKITIEESLPFHSGLGAGTQLALAVGKALLLSWELDMRAIDLALVLERGKRSAIGIHGFDVGGLIVEGGKLSQEIAPLVAHLEWPREWPIHLDFPLEEPGVHGEQESEVFQTLAMGDRNQEILEANSRNVLLGILPAVAQRNLAAARKFVRDMNTRTGQVFEQFNGEAVNRGKNSTKPIPSGLEYCGQSSWGPAQFYF
ncbi:MAG: hypothetical protein EXR99_03790 [Gemmataceae bacterium]|nr:hypothetical protein [Gemmataceae bacterium]